MASLPWPLLTLLADGQCHSGETLGKSLGVGRAAIWKMIQQLQALGIVVESVRGQGYQVSGGIDLLNEAAILADIDPEIGSLLSALEVHAQVDSTNTLLMQGNYQSGSVIFAEQQLAGRGRRGRVWVSPLAANIYCSVRWHFNAGIAALEGLSLAVGVALAEALAEVGVPDVMLKWPNDLWLGGDKLGGILVEVGGDAHGDCYAVVGVGINVAMPKAMSDAIDQSWTDLRCHGFSGSRNVIAAALVKHLLRLLGNYQQEGFAAYRARWLQRNALMNKNVVVTGAEQFEGLVTGLSPSGALLIQTPEGLRALSGGEVSVRNRDS